MLFEQLLFWQLIGQQKIQGNMSIDIKIKTNKKLLKNKNNFYMKELSIRLSKMSVKISFFFNYLWCLLQNKIKLGKGLIYDVYFILSDGDCFK
jgi:hypothetical protein